MEKEKLEKIAEHLSQKVGSRSLIHLHHKKPMIIVENNTSENNSEFYVCSEKGCDYKEIPYVAQGLGFNEENFYQGF